MPSQSVRKNRICPLPPAAERSRVVIPGPKSPIPRISKWSGPTTCTVWFVEELAGSTWVGAERAKVISPGVDEVEAAAISSKADICRCTSEARVHSYVNTPRGSLFKTLKVSSFHTSRNSGNIAVFGSDGKSIRAGFRDSYGCSDLFEGSDNAVQRTARSDISGHNPSGGRNDTDSQKSCQQGEEGDLSLHFE